MRGALRRRLLASQVAFFGGIAVDLGIEPHYLASRDEGGVSNFGVHASTAAPFTVAFAGSALALVAASRAVPPGPRDRGVRVALVVVAVALVAAMVTTYPYQHGDALHTLHLAVGAAAMLAEALVAGWLVARLHHDGPDVAGLALVLAGGVLGVLASVGVLRVLLVGQLLESAGLGLLLVRVPGALEGPEGPGEAMRAG